MGKYNCVLNFNFQSEHYLVILKKIKNWVEEKKEPG